MSTESRVYPPNKSCITRLENVINALKQELNLVPEYFEPAFRSGVMVHYKVGDFKIFLEGYNWDRDITVLVTKNKRRVYIEVIEVSEVFPVIFKLLKGE